MGAVLMSRQLRGLLLRRPSSKLEYQSPVITVVRRIKEVKLATDMVARRNASRAMVEYIEGTIDNFSLEDELATGARTDTACYELLNSLTDTWISASHRHRNESNYLLNDRQRRMMCRWIMFLNSTAEWPNSSCFSWPPPARWLTHFLHNLWRFIRSSSSYQNEYWPYTTEEEWKQIGAPEHE